MKMLTCAEDGDPCCSRHGVGAPRGARRVWERGLEVVNVQLWKLELYGRDAERGLCLWWLDGKVTRSMIDIEACRLLSLNG